MRLLSDAELNRKDLEGVILTLGNFDGVHLGHREIIKRVVSKAREWKTRSMVFTFKPHPLKIVAPERKLYLITTEEEKAELLLDLGIDLLYFARFTEDFARTHPEEFIQETIVERIGPRLLIVGYDYGFGRGRMGGIELLKEAGRKAGFEVEVVPPFMIEGEVVSSSLIRESILRGDVKRASRLLGRYYAIRGKVVKGAGRGKTIGFPTANIIPYKELLPARGVYATYVSLEGKTYRGVTNVGYCPTFNSGTTTMVEAYIMDLQRDIYGLELEVSFVERLRDERAFETPTHLADQIKRDIERAQEVLQ